ncbi:MAG TPA: hypothetical protein VGG85_08925 [Terracidiphilus sp.]|jgi:hypothetical protein
MKHFPAVALLVLAAVSAVPGALAQEHTLKANIPFNFTVGETSLPAGEYRLSAPAAGLVRIHSEDGLLTATVATVKGFNETKGSSKLVFDRYGSQYFLHRILCPTAGRMNVEIPAWKLEKRARSREAKLESGKQVLVAAN